MKTNCVPQIPLTGGWFPVNSRKRRRRSGAKKPLKNRAGTELSLARVSLQQPLRALCLGENANTRLPRSTLRLLISVTTSRFSLNLDLAKKKKKTIHSRSKNPKFRLGSSAQTASNRDIFSTNWLESSRCVRDEVIDRTFANYKNWIKKKEKEKGKKSSLSTN